jgi:hypothetical protein
MRLHLTSKYLHNFLILSVSSKRFRHHVKYRSSFAVFYNNNNIIRIQQRCYLALLLDVLILVRALLQKYYFTK